MVLKKKKPDVNKYRTIKCPLKSIIKNDLIITNLFDAMIRTHKIVIHTYPNGLCPFRFAQFALLTFQLNANETNLTK